MKPKETVSVSVNPLACLVLADKQRGGHWQTSLQAASCISDPWEAVRSWGQRARRDVRVGVRRMQSSGSSRLGPVAHRHFLSLTCACLITLILTTAGQVPLLLLPWFYISPSRAKEAPREKRGSPRSLKWLNYNLEKNWFWKKRSRKEVFHSPCISECLWRAEMVLGIVDTGMNTGEKNFAFRSLYSQGRT